MARKKNLERAIILGLILSTGVYGSAWAETSNGIKGSFTNKIPEESFIVSVGLDTAIELNKRDEQNITIITSNSKDGDVKLDSNKYGIYINNADNNTVSLNSANDNIITVDNINNNVKYGNGITIAGNSTDNSIVLNAEGSNKIVVTSIPVSTGKKLNDGIFIDSNAKGNSENDVKLKAGQNNEISAASNGISNKGKVNVVLLAQGGNIIIGGIDNKIGEQSPSSDDKFEANGIINENIGSISLTGSFNQINGKYNAVYNHGNGIITISALADKTNGEINTFANYDDYNNLLIAGENGVKSDSTGTTNVIADNNNYIAGTMNGILSDAAGVINVDSGNSNYIGQVTYTDKDDTGNEDTHTITSNTGINVTAGTVNVTAGGSNSIYGNLNGINVNGANSKVSLNSAANVITVNNSAGAQVNGINVDDDGFTEVKSTNGNIEINVETSGTLANAINVGDINGGGEVKLTTTNNGDILINVVTGMPNATNGNVYGIQADKAGKVTVDSANNIVVKTESTVVDQVDGGNNVSAIEADAAGIIDIDAKQFLLVDTKDINSANYGIRANEASALVDIDTKGKNKYGYGVLVNSSGKLSHAVYAQNASTEITAEGGGIYISADGIEATDALYLAAFNVDSHSILNANGDIVLTAYNDADTYVNTNYAAGVFTSSSNGYKSNAEVTGHDIY